MSDTETGALGSAGDLLAALVQRNVDDAAFTNRAIQGDLEAKLCEMAQSYIDLFHAVDECNILPRHLVRFLDGKAAWDYSRATDIVNSKGSR